ncbi:26S proteasome non-ATPase regulatory subunit 10 isoform X2 [Eutrema salsugineum]|nr:26S proteasome non-ATPase regulatory subunit 10 isoform X2 [Eutrema salsugineum]
MGPGDCQIMECKCGMPLCICVAPSQSTNTPNPQPTRAPVALPQSDPKTKSDTSAKSKGSTSSSNARLALNPGLDNPQRDYEVNGEGLREAIKNGDIAGVKKLLKEGVDANYHDKQGMSVLHLTALFNKTDIALMLMEHGASLEDKNAQGETPVDCAPATLQYKMREKMEKMMST